MFPGVALRCVISRLHHPRLLEEKPLLKRKSLTTDNYLTNKQNYEWQGARREPSSVDKDRSF